MFLFRSIPVNERRFGTWVRLGASRRRELLATHADLGTRRWVADAIELAAVILQRDDRPQPAARLLGACAGIRSSLGEPAGGLRAVAGAVQVSHDQLQRLLGERLPKEESAGARLSKDEALKYAVEWLE